MSETSPRAWPGSEWLIARIRAIHSNHRRIAGGALIIGLLTLVAKLFIAMREMAIAWRYGVSSTVDAYQLSLTATTWLPNMLTGVMAIILVPRLVMLQRRGEDRQSFVAELNGSVLLLGFAIAVLTWLAAPAAATLLASNLNSRTTELTAMMIARMAPVSLFAILSGYTFARLQARERFGYSVTDAVPAFFVALFVLGSIGSNVTQVLIVGTLCGYLLQFLALTFLTARGDPPIAGLHFRHRSNEWAPLYGSLLLMVSGQILITASIPIDQGFASRLGEGAVASLGYANRIVTLLSGLATLVVGRALLPVLSSAVAEGDFELGRRQTLQWCLLLGVAATLVSIVAWLAAPVVVRLLFQRGAFTSADTLEVSNVLKWGLAQLPFYFAGIALVQWYAATRRFRAFLIITGTALLSKVLLNAVLIPRLGLQGIMISTAGMYFVTLTLLLTLFGGWRSVSPLSDDEPGR